MIFSFHNMYIKCNFQSPEFPGMSAGLTGLLTVIRILLPFGENLIALDRKIFKTCSNCDLSPSKYWNSWPKEVASSVKKWKKKKMKMKNEKWKMKKWKIENEN